MSDRSYASLCFLSYNRPAFILEAVRSAVANADYPCEVIIHDDGSTDPTLIADLVNMLGRLEISRLILNPPGHNEGVGTAINRMFKLATGDPVIKLDQDLLFNEGWLSRAVGILRQDENIGMLGLFKYHHQPCVWSDQVIPVPTKGGYHYCRVFVGSAFAIPRVYWEKLGPLTEHSEAFGEDAEYMERVRANDLELALPDVDLVSNRGFGYGPSTVCVSPGKTEPIHRGPYVLNRKTLTPPQAEVEHSTITVDERRFDVGVVIPCAAGREENLRRTVDHLQRLDRKPNAIVVVYDDTPALGFPTPIPVHGVEASDLNIGALRNLGVAKLDAIAPECNYVWFLDSDLIFQPDILQRFYEGLVAAEQDRILIGPYEWLAPGVVSPQPALRNDVRWVSFDQYDPSHVFTHRPKPDVGAALACFSGNLVWPIDELVRVKGFHPGLRRTEDGELGLRAAAAGVPMSFVRDARGWHVAHPVDLNRVRQITAAEVPYVDTLHPWVKDLGLFVANHEDTHFEWRCDDCGQVEQLGPHHHQCETRIA